jgi:hypothetical protein
VVDTAIVVAEEIVRWGKFGKDTTLTVTDDAQQCPPTSVGFSFDVGSPIGCIVGFTGAAIVAALDGGNKGIETTNNIATLGKSITERALSDVVFGLDADFEIKQLAREMDALIREEEEKRLALFLAEDEFVFEYGTYDAELAKGFRLLEELIRLRKLWAGQIQKKRYNDMAYRVFQNSALQQYRQQFDQAQLYTFLAAGAYDYETNLDLESEGSGDKIMRQIIGERSLGEVKFIQGRGPVPIAGVKGLADPLARMDANFQVLKGQMGFNNPQEEQNAFSLRSELFRLRDDSDAAWRRELQRHYRGDIYSDPKVSRLAKRPFGHEGAQPGLVIPFSGSIIEGLNFFGHRLGAGDNAYDATQFATKIHSVGLWLEGYDPERLSNSPRVYLLPAGKDVMRPRDTRGLLRYWDVEEQLLPLPYEIGAADLSDPSWSPRFDGLDGRLFENKRYARLRAYPLAPGENIDPDQMNTDTRLIGRSVWNTEWLLVIPGTSLLAEPALGIERFIQDVDDIHLFLQSYAYAGGSDFE